MKEGLSTAAACRGWVPTLDITHGGHRTFKVGGPQSRLTVDWRGQWPGAVGFDGGQTEMWLDLPKGDYDAQLDLVGTTAADKRIARSEAVSFTVP